MSNSLLIYLGEGHKFDVPAIAISAIPGVKNPRQGAFVGAIFEAEYENTTVRLSPEAETINVGRLSEETLQFALKLQRSLLMPLRAMDMAYTFDVALKDFASLSELWLAVVKTH